MRRRLRAGMPSSRALQHAPRRAMTWPRIPVRMMTTTARSRSLSESSLVLFLVSLLGSTRVLPCGQPWGKTRGEPNKEAKNGTKLVSEGLARAAVGRWLRRHCRGHSPRAPAAQQRHASTHVGDHTSTDSAADPGTDDASRQRQFGR